MSATHRIKRLKFMLQVADQELARGLQQEVSHFCRHVLPALMAGPLEDLAPESLCRIERLELELPVFESVDQFRRQLGERLQETLAAELGEAASIHAATAGVPPAAAAEAKTSRLLTFDRAYQSASVYLHILQHGVTPWQAPEGSFDDAVRETLDLLKADPSFRRQFTAVLAASRRSRQRFVRQTPHAERIRMTALIGQVDESWLTALEKGLDAFAARLLRGFTAVPHPDRLVRETALQTLVQPGDIDDAQLGHIFDDVLDALMAATGKARQVWDQLRPAAEAMAARLPPRWRGAVRAHAAVLAVRGLDAEDDSGEAFAQTMAKGGTAPRGDRRRRPYTVPDQPGSWPADLSHRKDMAAESVSGDAEARPLERDRRPGRHGVSASGVRPIEKTPLPVGIAQRFAPDPQHATASPGPADPGAGLPWTIPYEADTIHIANAGLVLVAPFWGMVFKALGYLGPARDFAREDLRRRAVHFTQFVVTSQPHPVEGDLALNKILCGLALDEPLERYMDLTAAERHAAEELLDSVRENWSALRGTSRQVLQQTFLQHTGLLTRAEGHWRLQIERQSVDVLIDTLPWTISIIKHPWMPQAVMVEW